MTGVGFGGNKVRKLEFLLADAQNKGASIVMTTGGAQSNHAMLTAACCGRLGMQAVLLLKDRGVSEEWATYTSITCWVPRWCSWTPTTTG